MWDGGGAVQIHGLRLTGCCRDEISTDQLQSSLSQCNFHTCLRDSLCFRLLSEKNQAFVRWNESALFLVSIGLALQVPNSQHSVQHRVTVTVVHSQDCLPETGLEHLEAFHP